MRGNGTRSIRTRVDPRQVQIQLIYCITGEKAECKTTVMDTLTDVGSRRIRAVFFLIDIVK